MRTKTKGECKLYHRQLLWDSKKKNNFGDKSIFCTTLTNSYFNMLALFNIQYNQRYKRRNKKEKVLRRKTEERILGT